MKKKMFKASLIAALVSSISLTAHAATLVDVEGSVTVNRLGSLFPASNNMEIKPGDIISVYEGSARLSNCSEKIEMNQAVQFENEEACPVAKDLNAEFSDDQRVGLAKAKVGAGAAGLGLFAGGAGTAAAIGVGVLAAAAVVANRDDDPASP